MESYTKKYISNLVDSVLKKLYYDEHNINVFKHYNTFTIPLDLINEAVQKSGDIVQILYHEFKPGKIQSAYQPVLDWIIALYDRYYAAIISFEDFLNDAGVYSLHKPIYISYKERGICERSEEIVPIEIEYEHNTFLRGMIDILNYISEKIPLLLIINKNHLADISSLEFLYQMITANANSKIAVISGFNEVYTASDYVKEIRNDIILELETKNMIQDWGIEEDTDDEENDLFIPEASEFDKYVVLINNMIETGAVKQAVHYCDIISESIEQGDILVGDRLNTRFYQLYAKACFEDSNYSRTITLCDKLKVMCEKKYNLDDAYTYTYLTAMCHSCSGQNKLAEKAAQECKTIAAESGNEALKFKADMLECMVMFQCWTNVYLWGVEYDVDDNFLKTAEKYGYYNHLTYIHLLCFANDKSYYDSDPTFCESHEHYKLGMHYADILDNNSARLTIYNKNVVFSSGFGYYSAVDYFHQKSLEILDRQGNELAKGNVYNGLGYNRIVSEEFNAADDYFNDAMEIWYRLSKPDRMGETLYNMAVNAMLAHDYRAGADFLVSALRIMKNMNQLKLSLCNVSKLYGMLVLCYIKLGIEYNAQFYLNKMQLVLYHLVFPEKEPSFFMWDDDMFFYYFDKGLLVRKESLAEAQQNFERAQFHLKRTEGLWFFAYELFAVEQAELYRAQGRHFEANELLQNALDYCTKNNYKHKIERLNSALRGIAYEEEKYDISMKKVTMNQAIDISRRAGAELQLKLKKRSITFLTSWQELMNRDNIDINTLIETSMYTLQNHYNADKMIYIEMTNGSPNLVYCDKDYNPSHDVIQGIAAYFTQNPTEFMVNRLEKNFYDYRSIISLFGMSNIVSIIGVPIVVDNKLQSALIALIEMHENFCNNNVIFVEGDLTIFTVAFHQLVDSVSRLGTEERIRKMNAQLEQSAVTDMLTGLYNRQGFAKTIESELKKYSKNTNVTVTVLYIDLDNFKFYNDTFGHAIGDVLLVSFSDIFKQITKNRGYAIRYGGDEFVIVIMDSSEQEGVEIAESIYAKLDETDGFADKLKEKMGSDFVIDKKNRVSCSIGIATTDNFSVDGINEAMKHADDALYVIKKTTKHNYKVWEPGVSASR